MGDLMGQAPSEFTVAGVAAVSEEPWGDNKDMLTTEVLFAGDERQWKIHHNVAWPVEIKTGVVLEGWKDFEKGKFGLSNKHKGDHAKKPSGGGGYSGGGKSPDQQRSIVRQHSQEMALRFIAMTGDAKDMNFGDPTVVSAYLSETVKRLTDWFAQDAGSAPAAAPQSVPQPSLEAEVPADTSGLGNGSPAPTTADDKIPF